MPPPVNDTLLHAFSADTAANVTGFSVSQLQRWDRQGWFQPALADPDRRRPHSRIYSFGDLVNLRTLRLLHERGVPIVKLRKAWRYLSEGGFANLPSTRLYVANGDVYIKHEDATIAASRAGQAALPEVVELVPIIAEMRDRVRALSERTPEQVGRAERTPFIVNGEEVFAGTRIPVSVITAFLKQGWAWKDILQEYPRLREADLAYAATRLNGHAAIAS